MAFRVGWLHRLLARLLQRKLAHAGVGLELWDGRSCYEGPRPTAGELVVRDSSTLRGLVFNPHLQFGEKYMAGSLGGIL